MVAGEYSSFEDLAALLDGLGVERAALVGCSQGGRVALEFALASPERVMALVLVASALPGFVFEGENPGPWAAIDAACERGDLELANELELRAWVDGASRAPAEVDPAVRELVREMNAIALAAPADLGTERAVDPPVAGRLGAVACPTLVVWGDLDTPRTLAQAERLASGIAGARAAIVAGTAHLPSLERPGEFNRLVLEFLDAAS
jgi:pimeloyl-ACP methyl ester carboxylesterase